MDRADKPVIVTDEAADFLSNPEVRKAADDILRHERKAGIDPRAIWLNPWQYPTPKQYADNT